MQEVRDNDNWEEWIIYILKAIEEVANDSIQIIKDIKMAMIFCKKKIRDELRAIYSQDLLNIIFRHPYTRSSFLEYDLDITRKTASNYLNKLVDIGVLKKIKIGTGNYYFNHLLCKILTGELSS